MLASQAVAQADYTIRVTGGSGSNRDRFVTQIGPWGMNNPTLLRAIQLFGAPSSEEAVLPGIAYRSVPDCMVTWKQIGLRVVFTTWASRPTACDPYKAVWTATVTDKRWRTGKGLRVSDPKSRVFKLYPSARLQNGVGWVLFSKSFLAGVPKRVPSLSAKVGRGRISAFGIYVNTQGE
jgi:hypothetical protein